MEQVVLDTQVSVGPGEGCQGRRASLSRLSGTFSDPARLLLLVWGGWLVTATMAPTVPGVTGPDAQHRVRVTYLSPLTGLVIAPPPPPPSLKTGRTVRPKRQQEELRQYRVPKTPSHSILTRPEQEGGSQPAD